MLVVRHDSRAIKTILGGDGSIIPIGPENFLSDFLVLSKGPFTFHRFQVGSGGFITQVS